MADTGRNPTQMAGVQSNATFGRVSRLAPTVNEDGGATAFDRVGPIPIGQKDQIVKPVRAPELFVAMRIGRPHHQVVVFVGGII